MEIHEGQVVMPANRFSMAVLLSQSSLKPMGSAAEDAWSIYMMGLLRGGASLDEATWPAGRDTADSCCQSSSSSSACSLAPVLVALAGWVSMTGWRHGLCSCSVRICSLPS